MKKRLLSFVLLLVCMAVLATAVAFNSVAADSVSMTDVDAGNATVASGDTVTISSAAELTMLAKYVYEGKPTEGVTFLQTCNIAAETGSANNQSTMREIGTAENPFKGTYDGQGYKITNVQLTNRDANSLSGVKTNLNDYRAPFAYLEGATVKNLTIALGTKSGTPGTRSYLGGIAAKAVNSSILGCTVEADPVGTTLTAGAQIMGIAAGTGYVGGIVGHADGTVIDGCTVYVAVKGVAKVGGIVGYAENGTEIRNSRMVGSTDQMGTKKLDGFGGIAGELVASKIENCYASGNIKGYSKIGGIAGIVDEGSSVENCFSDAKASNSTNFGEAIVGAIAGENNGSVKYVYASASARYLVDNIVLFGTGAGTNEHVYLYDVVETEGKYEFVLGALELTNGEISCTAANRGNPCPVENCGTCEMTGKSPCSSCTAETVADCVVCGGTGFVPCVECGANHQVCNGTGLAKVDYYKFVAMGEDSSITIGSVTDIRALDVALNTWISELRAENAKAYANWAVVGSTIINCTHSDIAYKAHEGKAPTCTEPGFGDAHCALCDQLLTKDVEIPATGHKWDLKTQTCISAQKCAVCGIDNDAEGAGPTGIHTAPIGTKDCQEGAKCTVCSADILPTAAHTRPDNANACADATCTVCGGVAKSEIPHTPAADYTCKDTTCTVCGATIKASTGHVLAADAHLCQDNACTACGDIVAASLAHTRPEGVAACEENVPCAVCSENIPTGDRHTAGMAPGCERNQICTVCYKELQPALGHTYQGEQTCAEGITCKICGQYKVEILEDGTVVEYGPLGNDYCIPDKDQPTCTVGVYCSVCARRMVKPLGHAYGGENTCGTAQTCTVCHVIGASATGEHTYDWANVEVIRVATADTPGIIMVPCTDCGRSFERFTLGATTDIDGWGSVSDLLVGSFVSVGILPIADYADHAALVDSKVLQIVSLSVSMNGEEILAPNGVVTISFILNNTAALFDSAEVKIINLDTLEEISDVLIENGFIYFASESYGNFAIVTTDELYENKFTEPEEPEVNPGEPEVNPEEPEVNPEEPEVNPEEPEVNPGEPEVNPEGSDDAPTAPTLGAFPEMPAAPSAPATAPVADAASAEEASISVTAIVISLVAAIVLVGGATAVVLFSKKKKVGAASDAAPSIEDDGNNK